MENVTLTRQLYLDLLKRVLVYDLWPEPAVPLDYYNYCRKPWRNHLISIANTLLRARGVVLAKEPKATVDARSDGKDWPVYGLTMIGLKRLDNLQDCIEEVLRDGVKGDFIETGVWRGGACIFMRAMLKAYGIDDRLVWVADSFEGLPKPDPHRYPADEGCNFFRNSLLAVDLQEVQSNFQKFGLLDDQVAFLRGWFKDTLPKAPVQQLAILRLDGDMYQSTIESLEALYPKLSTGGFCIIDDYDIVSCAQAVDDFRRHHRVTAVMRKIDWTGVYWRKV